MHYQEPLPSVLTKIGQSKTKLQELKVNVWNSFVDSDFSDITDDDCSVLPRTLPASYLPVIERTCREITEILMKLVSLPEPEVRAIFPSGPIRDFLLDELQIIRHRPNRYVGSFRFDMAVVGKPSTNNPPRLLEVNEIGFDGLARMPFIQDTLLKHIPELKKQFFGLNTSAAEIRNMRRLGPSLARFQEDTYNWDEECLLRRAQELNYDLKLISPAQYKSELDPETYPFLKKSAVVAKNGKLQLGKNWNPHSFMVSFALELSDYLKAERFYKTLVKEKIPHYGPFLMGLVASKSILSILNDSSLRTQLASDSKLLNRAILPAQMLSNCHFTQHELAANKVLKFVDGFGGQQVFMGKELIHELNKIPKKRQLEWVIQDKVLLNALQINGILSRSKRVISDLGVFIQYDWANGKFRHFEVGGFLTRATNKSMKVNVSAGGAQVAVLFDRSR